MESEKIKNGFNSFLKKLKKPIDPSSMAIFRIGFGAILFYKIGSYLWDDLVGYFFIEPEILFKYLGFGWVHPLPDTLLYLFFYAMTAAALCITIGLFYRFSIIFFWLGFTYIFLLDKSTYVNHYYLVILLTFLMMFIPANQKWSIDSILFKKIRGKVPLQTWHLWILQFQFLVVYFFAGIYKLFTPDWFKGEPVGAFIRTYYYESWTLAGPFTNSVMVWLNDTIGKIISYELTPIILSIWVIVFQIIIAPLILWKKTRPYVFVLTISFHLLNTQLFSIGIFPWYMLVATTLFLSPEWPRKLFSFITRKPFATFFSTHKEEIKLSQPVAIVMIIFMAIQLVAPLRPYLYSDNASWNSQGRNFSWTMMSFFRDVDWDQTFYMLYDPITNETLIIDDIAHLAQWQSRDGFSNPDTAIQFAKHLKNIYSSSGYPNSEIRLQVKMSINGRKYQLWNDNTVDLSKEKRSFLAPDWILPFEDTPINALNLR